MAQNSVDSDRLSSAGISTHSSGTAGTVGGSVVGVRVGEPGLKREDEDEYNLGPLPPMWEKAFTPTGEAYFIDHNTGTSHWLDPRLARVRKHSLGECGEDELPYGWERVTDERYGSYYVDHINRRTQYENPVLQARRLRAEKIAAENGCSSQTNGQPPTGELRGERFTVTLTKGPQGLGFTLIGAEGVPEIEGYLQIRSVVPNSPAWIDGVVRAGDVLVGVGAHAVRGLSQTAQAQLFQSIAPGVAVTLHLVRGYPLPFASEDPHTRVLSTLAVDNTPQHMQQLTNALRTRFNLESPGAEAPQTEDVPDAGSAGSGPVTESRRMGRSFDMDRHQRCSSADQLLDEAAWSGSGRAVCVQLRRGAAGFGFTVADSVHGQKVKKVLDRSRCAGLREGDLLLQIGEVDVRHAPHQHVVQALKDCPAMHETLLKVWRRNNSNARAPRSRSATRLPTTPSLSNSTTQLGRSKTPTAEQLRSPSLMIPDNVRDRLNGMNSGTATYAVPEHKSLQARRRSSPSAALTLPPAWPAQGNWQESDTWRDNGNVRDWAENQQTWEDNQQHFNGNNQKWQDNQGKWNGNPPKWEPQDGNNWPADTWGKWGDGGTPTVHVDINNTYWRGNGSLADSSDNGGFPEEGLLHSPSTAAITALASHRQNNNLPRSPSNSTDRLRSQSPSSAGATERLLANSPSAHSASNHSSSGRAKGSPIRLREPSPPRHIHSPARHSPSCYNEQMPQNSNVYVANYPQVEAGGPTDPSADVLVRLGRGGAGFGFRIVGGTEDGTRVAVGYVVPGGPAEGLLRPGDLLTSVDGAGLAGATHARAVAAVCRAAARGHVTLGVRHNRADIQPIGVPNMTSPPHQQLLTSEPSMHHANSASYNILHPAPIYPPQAQMPMYGGVEPAAGGWVPPGAAAGTDVTVTRHEGEGFGFVVISSTNKATSTIGQLIPNSPAARCGLLRVGDTIAAINGVPIRNLPHPEVVALIKRSGTAVTLTVQPAMN